MKKKLDETTIVNELRGQSAFFRPASPAPDPAAPEETPNKRTEIRSLHRTEMRSEYPTKSSPIKRMTKRYSFEFCVDQFVKLKKLRRLAEDRGETTSLSEMAREAFDLYLERTENRSHHRTEKRSEFPTEGLPVKRQKKRYSFEFYVDQISRFKQLKRSVEDRGENISLSEMARQAFDQYLIRTEMRSE